MRRLVMIVAVVIAAVAATAAEGPGLEPGSAHTGGLELFPPAALQPQGPLRTPEAATGCRFRYGDTCDVPRLRHE